ncbi:SGNH/GDSL hydrolase family protein [Chitinophaga sp. GCM10012297]|uniref:SGNH/GDSL hydrolase family protein n=1 Tax=Chitinophaga chungangae TaxID=2821488 RepID=A0ABS3YBU4_9BACT|nr:SGNH/GDSL hydrolase family protein [Chitinophaga chungangae]MBO9152151.1 SGNH/GDSL hydrolase family protein [Chitinophaga chungangae]
MKTMQLKWIISGMLMMAPGHVAAQNGRDLIAASQAGASPLFFQPGTDVPLVSTAGFSDNRECMLRSGLPRFFQKAAAGKPLIVGFIGGSITQGNAGYRPQTARYLQSMYPAADMRMLNAGVSGTGTELGACRIGEQLLQHHPDLVFVEFAVNGAYAKGMEGIVRQIRRQSPGTDICFIYTVTGNQTQIYASGNIPENIQNLEKIAEHYGLPSVHMALQASLLEKDGKLLWKGKTADNGAILFSNDGIHPLRAGGNLYAAAIARSLEKMKKLKAAIPSSLPAPIYPDNWENAAMYDPRQIAQFSNGWQSTTLPQFASWFPLIQQAVSPGASFTFRFKGSAFGIFDVGGPEAGQITIQVNGKTMKTVSPAEPGTQIYRIAPGDSLPVNRFNVYCNNRYRGQHQLFSLEPGDYTVTITLSSQKADKAAILGPAQAEDIGKHPEKYDRTVLYLGKILLKGKPVLNGNR